MSTESLSLPSGYEWQYQLLLWIQSFHSPRLDRIAMVLSWCGTEWFYILALPVLFWSIHKTIGLRIAYMFLFSMYLNGWIKDTARVARPIGIPGVRSLFVSSAPGYSFPSGHAQGPATFWVATAKWAQRWWFWFLALLLVAAIGVSRLYLGLHWPVDVLIGWALGLVLGFVGWRAGRWWTYRQYGFALRIALAILLPAIGIAFHPGTASLEYACLLLAVGVGALVEERYWNFQLAPMLWTRVCTAVIGLAGLIALYLAFHFASARFSQGSLDPLYTLWLCARDLLMGMWATLGAPHVFWRCGLYRKQQA